jgi:hypothetical protein
MRVHIPEDEDEFPPPLAMAFLRRCQREIAVRNLPLGIISADSEYGPQRISQYDAIIDQHERPYVVQIVG